MDDRAIWIEIDRKALARNYAAVKSFVGLKVNIICVVKANAYGHGLLKCARVFARAGADILATGSIRSGLKLREAGIYTPILVLGPSFEQEIKDAIDRDLTLTVVDLDHAHIINRQARHLNKQARVHLKVDTGFARLGIWYEMAGDEVEKIIRLPNLRIDGLFTHLAGSYQETTSMARQLNLFSELVQGIKDRGFKIPTVHAAKSETLLRFASSHFDAVRPGLLLYGLYPNPAMKRKIKVSPALSMFTKIAQVKQVPKGTKVGYNGTQTTRRQTKLAILPVGYQDGYDRRMSNLGYVLVSGKRASILGRISMGLTAVDISDIPHASVGSKVTLIGRDGHEEITVDEIATLCKTINYEIITRLPASLPRTYR